MLSEGAGPGRGGEGRGAKGRPALAFESLKSVQTTPHHGHFAFYPALLPISFSPASHDSIRTAPFPYPIKAVLHCSGTSIQKPEEGR